jgi:ornithine cyclodeaminase/alanine dehydrogenase-like protein (mu-crystallin family)
VKLVTVMPDNAIHGLPTVQAVIVWFDAASGTPRAIMDGGIVTAMRTGAASGVATRILASPGATTLAMIGAGVQAEWQVRAVCAARPIERVIVYAPTPASREAFAERMEAELAVSVDAVASAEEAVRQADVVCCATTSATPVFDADRLRAGTHVNGIGAFHRGMVELPPALFGRAAVVAVDSLGAAREEAGDLMAAIEQGHIDEGSIVEIGALPADHAANRDPEAVTVFKSVGLAIQDVAVAELIAQRVIE